MSYTTPVISKGIDYQQNQSSGIRGTVYAVFKPFGFGNSATQSEYSIL